MPAGIADDQSKDFDFEKTEMKYDSTGMFHWSPARNLEDCILVCIYAQYVLFFSFTQFLIAILDFTGSKSSRNDRSQWTCGGVPICRSRFTTDWAKKFGNAIACIEFPLSRIETCRYCWFGGLYSTRMENATKFTENLRTKWIAIESSGFTCG